MFSAKTNFARKKTEIRRLFTVFTIFFLFEDYKKDNEHLLFARIIGGFSRSNFFCRESLLKITF